MNPNYACASCGATGVKLWRRANSFSPDLWCVSCAGEAAGPDVAIDIRVSLAPDGTILNERFRRTDQIRGMVPAVPLPDASGYYSYTCTPPLEYEKWSNLPNCLETPCPV